MIILNTLFNNFIKQSTWTLQQTIIMMMMIYVKLLTETSFAINILQGV